VIEIIRNRGAFFELYGETRILIESLAAFVMAMLWGTRDGNAVDVFVPIRNLYIKEETPTCYPAVFFF
jgi:hypothetical protein